MTQKSLSKWLKGIIIGIALCGLVIYGFLLPMFGRDLAVANPEFAYCYEPWLAILWISAVPCYLVLYNGWKIFGDTEIPLGRVPGIPSGSRRRGGKGGTDVFRDIAIPRRGIYNGKKFKPV